METVTAVVTDEDGQLIGRVKTEEHQKNYEIIERVNYT